MGSAVSRAECGGIASASSSGSGSLSGKLPRARAQRASHAYQSGDALASPSVTAFDEDQLPNLARQDSPRTKSCSAEAEPKRAGPRSEGASGPVEEQLRRAAAQASLSTKARLPGEAPKRAGPKGGMCGGRASGAESPREGSRELGRFLRSSCTGLGASPGRLADNPLKDNHVRAAGLLRQSQAAVVRQHHWQAYRD